jgi:hypothetical protein
VNSTLDAYVVSWPACTKNLEWYLPQVVLVMLEGLLKHTKTPIETFAKLLAMKTEVTFARGSPFDYIFEDMNLDGVNAFHLAARFHAQSLLTIVKFLRQNDILEHVSPLLLG